MNRNRLRRIASVCRCLSRTLVAIFPALLMALTPSLVNAAIPAYTSATEVVATDR